MSLFQRRAAVTLDALRFEAGGPNDLRLRFKVKQTLSEKHNTADASVFGLAQNSRAAILSLVDRIPRHLPQFTIEAGYLDLAAAIFRGSAIKAENKRASPGWETFISATDGCEEGQKVVNKAFAPGASVADAIAELARVMGVSAANVVRDARAGKFGGKKSIWANGIVLSGTARSQMDMIAKTLGVQWTIQSGKLIVQRPKDATAEEAIFLTAKTGLLGSPVYTVDKDRPGKKIIKARSLLQAGLRPGRIMRVDFVDSEVQAKIYEVEHTGDTRGQEWYSDAVGEVGG